VSNILNKKRKIMKNLKFILLSALLGIVLGSSIYFIYNKSPIPTPIPPPMPTAIITPMAFSYTPTPPTQNGKIKAVVIIGSSGFDGFIIKIDKDKNWELKKAYWGKESKIWDGNADSNDIMRGFRNFLTKIGEDGKKFGAKNLDRRVPLIVSSGALKANKATLKIIDVLKKNGWNTKKITFQKEAKYGFLVAVPKEYLHNSFFVDIGSGNTKIAYMENNKIKTLEGYGSKAYKTEKSLEDVYNNIKTLIEDIPIELRERAFMIGGIPFKLAKGIKKDGEKYTILLQPNEYDKLKNKRKMEYGLKIYQGIKDGTQTKQYIFPWDANFGIGFLIDKRY
jgi:hypothetical protein